MCEEFLDGGEGDVPRDYKFFCFHGEPQFVQVDYNRFSGHARTLYDMEWKMLPCVYEYPLGPDESGQPPYLFDKMIEILNAAEKLKMDRGGKPNTLSIEYRERKSGTH